MTKFAGVEMATSALAIAVGLIVAIGQLAGSGWISGGGTVVLLALAAVAASGGALLLRTVSGPNRAVRALALLLVSAAPTGFAYPINLLVLVCAFVEGVLAVRRRRSQLPATSKQAGAFK